jgi:hypothetical protein
VLPGAIYRAPRSWAERSYHKLIYWHEAEKGGHVAAWEQPAIFAAEIRAAVPVAALTAHPLPKEAIMSHLEKVPYTAKIHTT